MKSDTQRILTEILSERDRQREKWGGDFEDDIRKDPIDWASDIQAYATWAKQMMRMRSHEKYRKRMMQIAALAVAACESFDRQETK